MKSAQHVRSLALWESVAGERTIRGEATFHGLGWLGSPMIAGAADFSHQTLAKPILVHEGWDCQHAWACAGGLARGQAHSSSARRCASTSSRCRRTWWSCAHRGGRGQRWHESDLPSNASTRRNAVASLESLSRPCGVTLVASPSCNCPRNARQSTEFCRRRSDRLVVAEQGTQVKLDGIKWRGRCTVRALERRDNAPVSVVKRIGDEGPVLGPNDPIVGHPMPAQH